MTGVIHFLKNSEKPIDWLMVKQEFNKPGFLTSVVDFNCEKISMKTVDFVTKNFTENKEWDYDKISNASKVAGPLALWLESAIKFAQIAHNIEPLRI